MDLRGEYDETESTGDNTKIPETVSPRNPSSPGLGVQTDPEPNETNAIAVGVSDLTNSKNTNHDSSTKGQGLRTWRRIYRETRKDSEFHRDLGKPQKRVLQRNFHRSMLVINDETDHHEISSGSSSILNHSVSRPNPTPALLSLPSFTLETDSEQSEDYQNSRTSKPQFKFLEKKISGHNRNKMKNRSKKARERIHTEMEHSRSSIESDSRSFLKQDSSIVAHDDDDDGDDDDDQENRTPHHLLSQSVISLKAAREALEEEVGKLVVMGEVCEMRERVKVVRNEMEKASGVYTAAIECGDIDCAFVRKIEAEVVYLGLATEWDDVGLQPSGVVLPVVNRKPDDTFLPSAPETVCVKTRTGGRRAIWKASLCFLLQSLLLLSAFFSLFRCHYFPSPLAPT